MTVIMKENDCSIPLCHETLDVVKASKPRALQRLQATNNKAPSSSKNNKKNKKRRAAKNLKSLDDAIKEQDLCSCGNKLAAKCANQQCVKCCSGCPRHIKKEKTSKAKTMANMEPTSKKVVANAKEEPENEKIVANAKEIVVEPQVTEAAVGSPFNSAVSVETVDIHDEGDAAVVPIDFGSHHDFLGSFIRALVSFPNFCPE